MRADKRKFHFLYRAVCVSTKRFYVGMHSTNCINDGYCGSGTLLWRSRQKHGDENHSFEILMFYNSRIELRFAEKQLIASFLDNPLCMNLAYGGEGGWDYVNDNRLGPNLNRNHPAWNKMQQAWHSAGGKKVGAKNFGRGMLGRRHSEATKQLMSESHKGANLQRWVKNLETGQAKRLPPTEAQSLVDSKEWAFGR
jgi:hypothetical protein